MIIIIIVIIIISRLHPLSSKLRQRHLERAVVARQGLVCQVKAKDNLTKQRTRQNKPNHEKQQKGLGCQVLSESEDAQARTWTMDYFRSNGSLERFGVPEPCPSLSFQRKRATCRDDTTTKPIDCCEVPCRTVLYCDLTYCLQSLQVSL